MNIRPTTWKNEPSDLSVQQRLIWTCATPQSDQSHRFPHAETLHRWLSKMCPVRIPIRLCECASWSDSSLGTRPKVCFLTLRFINFLENIILLRYVSKSDFYHFSFCEGDCKYMIEFPLIFNFVALFWKGFYFRRIWSPGEEILSY